MVVLVCVHVAARVAAGACVGAVLRVRGLAHEPTIFERMRAVDAADLAAMVRLANEAAATVATRIRVHPATLALLRQRLAEDQSPVVPSWALARVAVGVEVVEDVDVARGTFVLDYADGHSTTYPEEATAGRTITGGTAAQ